MSKQRLAPAAVALLRAVEEYLERTGMPRTVFGLKAVNDGHFIRRLEKGREPRNATVERVTRYLER